MEFHPSLSSYYEIISSYCKPSITRVFHVEYREVIFRNALAHNSRAQKDSLFFMSEKGPFVHFILFVFLVFYFTSCFNPKINVVS